MPWGDEAFAKARREDKPIFLSVGYSTCHWCHVMAHESFEDERAASILNEVLVAGISFGSAGEHSMYEPAFPACC